MARSLATFVSNLATKTKDPNLTSATATVYLNDAIREVKSDYRIRGAVNRKVIKIYNEVNEYALPIPTSATETDFESICDLSEWFEGTQSLARFNRISPPLFARKPSLQYQDNYLTPYLRNDLKTLLVDYDPGTSNVSLHNCDSLTANGTWTASGDANTLIADIVTFWEGGGSLRFDITPSGLTAILTNSTMTAIDLTSYLNAAGIFMILSLPTGATALTQIEFRWGSSSSAYWTKTVTVQQNGLAFASGEENLLNFDWATATKTGSPDITAINYLQFRMTYSSAQAAATSFRLDNIVARQGKNMYFLYNSSSWVKTAAGVLASEFTSTVTDSTFRGTDAEADLVETKAQQLIHVFEIVDDLKAAICEKKYLMMLRNLKAQNPMIEKNQSFVWTGKGIF